VIVEYIDAHRDAFGVDPICRVLTEQAGVQIAPSTYYAAKQQGPVSAAEFDDAYDANTLFDLWVADRRVYGVRKLWQAAKRAGHDWDRDRVARLMRIAGIDGVVRGKHTTRTTERDEGAPPRHPDLLNRAWSAPTHPDQWWVADFTYVWTLQGFCYTAFCVDVFSR
jgi:putative transposase